MWSGSSIAVLVIPPAAIQLAGLVVGLGNERRRGIAHQVSLGGLAGLLVLELLGIGARNVDARPYSS